MNPKTLKESAWIVIDIAPIEQLASSNPLCRLLEKIAQGYIILDKTITKDRYIHYLLMRER